MRVISFSQSQPTGAGQLLPRCNIYDKDSDVVELGDEFFKQAQPAKGTDPEFVASWHKAQREGALKVRPRGRPGQDKNQAAHYPLHLNEEITRFFFKSRCWKTAGAGKRA